MIKKIHQKVEIMTKKANIWNVGDIGFILGFTRAQIIEIDITRKKTPSKRGLESECSPQLRDLKVRYLKDSLSNPKGFEVWIRRQSFSKKMRKGYTIQ